MKNALLKITVILCLTWTMACGNQAETSTTEAIPDPVTVEVPVEAPTPRAVPEAEAPAEAPVENTLNGVGSFVGYFEAEVINKAEAASYSNRITLVVDEVREGYARGRSIVAGNNRPWEGTAQKNDDRWEVEGKEPGDDRYDGAFQFFIDPGLEVVMGEWTANDANLAVSKRSYSLKKKTFTYDPTQDLEPDYYYEPLYGTVMEDEYEFPVGEVLTNKITIFNASEDRLTAADVENLYAGDLEVIRNTIYARHGYSFKNRKMRYFFDHFVDWYIPYSTDVRDQLTDIEKANIELLKRYEQHNERYYDSFGR